MTIEVCCESCEAKFRLTDAAAGRTFRCRKCRHEIKIPALTDRQKAAQKIPQAKPGNLSCPACRTMFLQVRKLKNGLTIDECATCKGTWLDGDELHELSRSRETVVQSLTAFSWGSTESSRICPRCHETMFEGTMLDDETTIEFCQQCEGLWFDASELRDTLTSLKQASELDRDQFPDDFDDDDLPEPTESPRSSSLSSRKSGGERIIQRLREKVPRVHPACPIKVAMRHPRRVNPSQKMALGIRDWLIPIGVCLALVMLRLVIPQNFLSTIMSAVAVIPFLIIYRGFRRTQNQLALFENSSVSKIRDLQDGAQAVIQGQILEAAEALTSTIHHERCVYFESLITDLEHQYSEEQGTTTSRQNVMTDSEAVSCLLDDGTGTVILDLNEADIHVARCSSIRPPDESLLSDTKLRVPRFEERVLKAGDRVLVAGCFSVTAKGAPRVGRNEYLVVSDRGDRGIKGSHERWRLYLYGLIAACIAIVLFGLIKI